MPRMTPFFVTAGADPEVQRIRRHWYWFVAIGVVLTLIGFAAIGYPIAATLLTVELFGAFLVASAGVQFASAIWGRGWGGFVPHLLCGLMSLFLGLLLLESPALGAAGYTLVLSLFFVASGSVRLVVALFQQFPGWGWTMLGGLVTIILGTLIWRGFPGAALWVIGLFVGIDLVFTGWSWVMLGLGVRAFAPAPEPAADALVRA